MSEFGFRPVLVEDYLPENAVYRLIFKAKSDVAIAFQSLLVDEILPSLRKNGIYVSGKSEMNDEEFLANAVLRASAVIEKKNAMIKQLENNVKQLEDTLEEQEPLVILAQKLEENPDCWHSFKDAASLSVKSPSGLNSSIVFSEFLSIKSIVVGQICFFII